jgi:ferritin-like protein
MASEGLHESADQLRPETKDLHRAIVSLMEELEAIDWYGQRVDAAGDVELRAILAHNRGEEQEHAAMVLEWIRRHDAGFDRHLRAYLFTEGSIVGREQAAAGAAGAAAGAAGAAAGAAGAAAANETTNGTWPRASVGSLRENP